jgi:ABC-type multidrug transport system fused ATPase/permease subunit
MMPRLRAADPPHNRKGALKSLWRLVRPRWAQAVSLSLLLTLTAALGQVSPQFVRLVIDELIPRGEGRLFLLMAAGMLLFYLLTAALGYAAMYHSYAFTQHVISEVRLEAYGKLLRLPLARFTGERSGSLVSRVVADVNALETMIQSGASRLLGQLFSVVVVMVILFATDWVLALVALVIVFAMALFTGVYQGPLRESARRIRARVGDLTATATEAIGNIAVVKSFANEGLEYDRFAQDNRRYVAGNLARRKQVGLMEALVGLSADVGLAVVLVLGGWLVLQRDLTVGELSAFLLYLGNLVGPVRSVMFFNNALQAGLAALERVDDLLHDLPEREGGRTVVPHGALAFHEVTFRYPGGGAPALCGLSFTVEAGQTVALVGPSGAGKSTVAKLVSRLYDPDEGEILLGGFDLRAYALSALRGRVAVVPQEPTLFSGSVLDNIRYAKPEATDDEVREAARLANAETFILGLPRGFDTEIGERGVKLSGGQKQRVALARAILKEATVLILDEATSSLDAESEAIIQDALVGLFKRRSGVTTLIIAHRLSTVRGADVILVLNDGRLAERGTHRELVARRGLYWALQRLAQEEGRRRAEALGD